MIRRHLALLRSHTKTAIDALYYFDDRLYERMEASRLVTVISASLVWICLLLLAATVWAMRHDSRATGLTIAGCFLCATAMLAAAAASRLRRQTLEHRNKFGRCLACGYDLCATPDRCPECGSVPAARVDA
ncbi:MAG: hypothetical protein JWP03_603 [Phycisphaerales bacterium]|nr:hypothetical protein [Phycisphaerales bacterium]